MFAVSQFKCSKCSVEYDGLFKLNEKGTPICKDCIDKKIYFLPKLEESQDSEAFVLMEFLSEDFMKLHSLYETWFLDSFLTEDGSISLEKLYFQGNDIKKCLHHRENAYRCLKYIETSLEEQALFCKRYISLYLELRINPICQTTMPELDDLEKTKEFSEIVFETIE